MSMPAIDPRVIVPSCPRGRRRARGPFASRISAVVLAAACVALAGCGATPQGTASPLVEVGQGSSAGGGSPSQAWAPGSSVLGPATSDPSLAPSGGAGPPANGSAGGSSSPSSGGASAPDSSAAAAPSSGPEGSSARPAAGTASTPWFTHAYVIMLENREYGQIVGNRSAPYLNSLIARYGLETAYYASRHGSQADYVDLFAGSNLGVVDNTVRDLSAPNLLEQLDRRGLSWHVYAQDYPGACFRGAAATGGVDLVGAPGEYERAHNPAISFTSIRADRAGCSGRITSLAGFDPAAANFEFIVPNLQNDMDVGSVAAGDAFLRAFVPRIVGSPAFTKGMLFITWDEGTTNASARGGGGGGHVPLIVVGPHVPAGLRSARPATELDLLRTLEDNWGLGCLANACRASALTAFLRR